MSGLGAAVWDHERGAAPIRVKHISAKFEAWLRSRQLTYFRLNNRINPGAPHFVVVFQGGKTLAILLQRGDDRAKQTDLQLDTLDYLHRAGWATAIAPTLQDAIESVEGVARG